MIILLALLNWYCEVKPEKHDFIIQNRIIIDGIEILK